MDMSKWIEPKSDQLNADSLIGGPITVTITSVRGAEGDQPVAVHYEGDGNKPFKPCKSMRRVMVACWGKDAAKYAGRSMMLYRDPDVQFGGMKVGGIRISHMSDIDGKKQLALTATRGKKAPFTVQPLTDAPRPAAQQPATDHSATLAELETAANEGTDALQTKWQGIGADARKALVNELPRLKSLATPPAQDDVPFDSQPAAESYDGV